jgi:hypothetical protein
MAFPSVNQLRDFAGWHVLPFGLGVGRNEENLFTRNQVVVNHPRTCALSAPGAFPTYLAPAPRTGDNIPGFRVLSQPESKGFVLGFTLNGFSLLSECWKFDKRSHNMIIRESRMRIKQNSTERDEYARGAPNNGGHDARRTTTKD